MNSKYILDDFFGNTLMSSFGINQIGSIIGNQSEEDGNSTTINMAGYGKEDVEISIEKGVLLVETLDGKHSFSYTLGNQSPINPDLVKVSLKNGLLVVKTCVSKENKKIPLKIEG